MGSTASQSERCHEIQEQYNSQHKTQQSSKGHRHLHMSEYHEDEQVELQTLNHPVAEWPYKDTLQYLGYEVAIYNARRYEVAKYPNMTFYKIREPNTHAVIGRFTAYTSPTALKEETKLVVLEINTRVGQRRLSRPKAYEILAGFWEHTLRQDIRHLQSLYFDTVTEHSTVSIVRHHVCPLMQVAWQWHHQAPQANITLRAPDPNSVEFTTAEQTEAWGLLHDESKLVRLANSLLSSHPHMALESGRLQIKQLDILPQSNERGDLFAFDLQISFGGPRA